MIIQTIVGLALVYVLFGLLTFTALALVTRRVKKETGEALWVGAILGMLVWPFTLIALVRMVKRVRSCAWCARNFEDMAHLKAHVSECDKSPLVQHIKELEEMINHE